MSPIFFDQSDYCCKRFKIMVKLKKLGRPILKRLAFSKAIFKSFKEFLSKTAVHAYHRLVEPGRHWLETSLWVIVHCFMLITSIYIVMFAWSRFTDNPTITTLETQHHSIFNLEFPGIAICSSNKISKVAAETYADYLLTLPNLDPLYRDKEKLFNLIRYFGRLYDHDMEGSEFFERFQEILDQIDSDNKTGIFDAERRLRLLAPKCEDYVLKCKWGGEVYKCPDIIRLRRTYTGYCCTFNYVRQSGDEKGQTSLIPAGIGGEMGLTVLLNLSSSDYYYPMRNYVGATVMIFDSNDFPESSTGELQEVPLEGGQEIRVTVAVNTKIADDQVQRYGIEKRKCMFKTDLNEEYSGDYSYGSCLLKCKIRSVLALCNCKLYNLPTNFPDIPLTEIPYCSLGNVGCLSKYKIKWATFRPREFIKVLSREMEDSLNCESCYPMCSSSKYTIDSTSADLNFFYENRGSVIANMEESKDLTVLKVYFAQADSVLYRTTVLYAWYDILSDYGGILSLCLGCSIISFLELIYFLTFRSYQNIFNNNRFLKKLNAQNQQKNNIFAVKPSLVNPKFEFLH